MVLTHWCMVTYVSDLSHQLETEEQISVKIESRYNNFLSSKKTFENVCKMAAFDTTRGVTIRVPHDTIRISIQRSRYNTYLNTYLKTVRCQRDVMSSMKAETPVIRSPTHNLLLQWMEYLLLQLPMLSQDVTLLSYIRVFPSIWSEKTMCFN